MYNFNSTPANYICKYHLDIKAYSNISDTPNSNNTINNSDKFGVIGDNMDNSSNIVILKKKIRQNKIKK